MKNLISVLLVLTMAFSFAGCASADNNQAKTTQTSAKNQVQTVAAKSTPAATETAAPKDTSSSNEPVCTVSGGGYVVDVMKAEVAKDGLGNDCIAIRFKYTNNNSYEMAFAFIAMETVRQGGQTLTVDGMVVNGNDASQTNLCQWISNGQSIDVTYIYPYNSDEDISFSLNLVKDLNSVTPLASGSCTLTLQ